MYGFPKTVYHPAVGSRIVNSFADEEGFKNEITELDRPKVAVQAKAVVQPVIQKEVKRRTGRKKLMFDLIEE
jgi:hypothetical protein